MNDVRQQIVDRYTALSIKDQILFLAKLADRLTLSARDTYDDHYGVADGVKLRAYNEAENRIVGQLVQLLISNERRYPDDVFANILADQFEILKLAPEKIFAVFDTI